MRRIRSTGNPASPLRSHEHMALGIYGASPGGLLQVLRGLRRDLARNRICALALPAMAWV